MVVALNVLAFFCLALICYSDFRWLIIPNSLSAALFLGGLLAHAQQGWAAVTLAAAFAGLILALMWSIRYVHHRLTGRVGLGLGDVKLAGAAAAWFSAWMFPFFLFVASSLALVFFVAIGLRHDKPFNRKIPFGPFLAASLLITWNVERHYGPLLGPAP